MVDLLLAFQSLAMLVSLLTETGALIAPKASHLREAPLLSAKVAQLERLGKA